MTWLRYFFRKGHFNSNEKKQRYLLQYKCATQQQLLPVQLFGQSLQIVSLLHLL